MTSKGILDRPIGTGTRTMLMPTTTASLDPSPNRSSAEILEENRPRRASYPSPSRSGGCTKTKRKQKRKAKLKLEDRRQGMDYLSGDALGRWVLLSAGHDGPFEMLYNACAVKDYRLLDEPTGSAWYIVSHVYFSWCISCMSLLLLCIVSHNNTGGR